MTEKPHHGGGPLGLDSVYSRLLVGGLGPVRRIMPQTRGMARPPAT
jgi:hypothetical protein